MRFNLPEIFTLDLRSLAMMRIGIGMLTLVDIFSRAKNLTSLHGDAGVFPTSLINSFWAGEWAWSLHAVHGGPLWLLISLFVVHGIAALALTVGFQTRIASVVTWLLLLSLHNVNPLIVDGGDVLLRVYLFIGMFLPWGAVFSIDHLRGTYTPKSVSILSGWSVAFMLQVGLFYLFASLLKSGREWTTEGSAVYYALSIDQYATSLGKWLLTFPDLLTVLTHSVVMFQHIALFLLFSPFLNSYLRTLALACLIFMHTSFAFMMHLWIFSWVAIAGLVGLLPTMVWDRSATLFRRFGFNGKNILALLKAGKKESRDFSRDFLGVTGTILGLAFIVFTFLWQVNAMFPEDERVSGLWDIPVKILRIDQRWGLFAPRPFKNDGWYIIDGYLAKKEHIDLLHGGSIFYEKPESVFDSYQDVRWRKYLYELRQPANAHYREFYGKFLCRKWNDSHLPDDQLESISVIYMTEITPRPGRAPEPIQPISLLEWKCE